MRQSDQQRDTNWNFVTCKVPSIPGKITRPCPKAFPSQGVTTGSPSSAGERAYLILNQQFSPWMDTGDTWGGSRADPNTWPQLSPLVSGSGWASALKPSLSLKHSGLQWFPFAFLHADHSSLRHLHNQFSPADLYKDLFFGESSLYFTLRQFFFNSPSWSPFLLPQSKF